MALILDKTDSHGFVSAFHQLSGYKVDYKTKKVRYWIERFRSKASRAAGEESIKTIIDEVSLTPANLSTLRAATSGLQTFIFNHAKGTVGSPGELFGAEDVDDDISDES